MRAHAINVMTWTAAGAALLALGACTFAPSSHPPAMRGLQWYGAGPLPRQTVAALGTAQQFVQAAQPVPAWWRLYQCEALDALVREGLNNSPTLSAAEFSLAAARDQLRASVASALLPSIDFAGAASRTGIPGVVEGGADAYQYKVFAGQLQASYTFDLFGATRYSNAARSARVDEQAYRFDGARRALAANIVTTVIAAAMLREQIAETEQLVAIGNELAYEAQQRYDSGAVPLAEMLAARQSVATVAASLPALRQQQLSARHALAALLGRTPDNAPAAFDLAQLHLPTLIPVVVPSDLLHARPDIQAAEATLRAAAADVGAATAQFFPSISLGASIGRGGLDLLPALSGAGTIWSAGAWLTQPIFHGGALVAQRRGAQHAYEAATAQYRAVVLGAFANVSDALAALVHDAQALDAASSAADNARQIADQAAARLQLGAVPVSAVHLSGQRWHTARLDEIRYMGARLTDTAALFQAMGSTPDEVEARDAPVEIASPAK